MSLTIYEVLCNARYNLENAVFPLQVEMAKEQLANALDAIDNGKTLNDVWEEAQPNAAVPYKPTFTPHVDTGDHVIVINAAKVVLTGKKLDQKVYYHHSGYVGGLKETKYSKLMAEKPEFAVKHAILGMMPKGPLGRQMARKLRVYAGAEHEHEAQKPEVLELVK